MTVAYQVHRVSRVAVPAAALRAAMVREFSASPPGEPFAGTRANLMPLLGHVPALRRLLSNPCRNYLWYVSPSEDGRGLVVEDFEKNRAYLVRPVAL